MSGSTEVKRCRWGFTLVELLVVFVMLAILVGLFLVMSSGRNARGPHPPRAYSASNLRGIGQAMLVYAVANDQHLPRYPASDANADVQGFTGRTNHGPAFDPFGDPDLEDNITASLWILVRQGDLSPDMFINPATQDRPYQPHAPLAGTFDFADPDQSSYSFMNFYHTEAREQWSEHARSDYVWAGDDNDGRRDTTPPTIGENRRWTGTDKAAWNSSNHRGRGQNFLRADGSVAFAPEPAAGPNGDNAYARDTNPSATAETLAPNNFTDKAATMDLPRDVALIPNDDFGSSPPLSKHRRPSDQAVFDGQ